MLGIEVKKSTRIMKITLSSIMGMGVHDGHEGTMRGHGVVGL